METMTRPQTAGAEDKRQALAEQALSLTRDEIYMELPFFGTALANLSYRPDHRLATTATDGESLFYQEEQILRLFEKNAVYLNRLYLHSLLHCLFCHLWLRGDWEERLWGIACDIAVEYTIDRLDKNCTRRILGLIRTDFYKKLEESERGVSAAIIYRELQLLSAEKQEQLYREFLADDHVFWPQENRLSEKQVLLQKKWNGIGRQTEEKRRRGHEDGEGSASVSYQIKATKSRRNYREFLRQFMVLHEELQIDPDEFDIGYYMYGLSLYDNMPLIEPIETKEVNRIRDFVVVVDTSYSTSGELIRSFLRETLQLLRERDNFFRENRLHLIQADDAVREDVVLTGEADIERMFSEFEVKGGGNTDFRPAFTYVDELVAEGAFEQLCGLLYFTDGLGIFPEKQPDYKTAFIFLDTFENENVPPWAIRIVLDEAQLGAAG